MSERQIIRIAITSSAKEAVEKVCADLGMTQQEVASRVYEWFAAQDRTIQLSALRLLPEALEAQAADLYMEQVKAKRSKGPAGKKRRDPK